MCALVVTYCARVTHSVDSKRAQHSFNVYTVVDVSLAQVVRLTVMFFQPESLLRRQWM